MRCPTDAFNAFHLGSTHARTLLERFCIGEVERRPEDKVIAKTEFEREYRELGIQMRSEGMMKAKCVGPARRAGAKSPALPSHARAPLPLALPPLPAPSFMRTSSSPPLRCWR